MVGAQEVNLEQVNAIGHEGILGNLTPRDYYTETVKLVEVAELNNAMALNMLADMDADEFIQGVETKLDSAIHS